MEQFYAFCAVAGGTVFLGQFLLSLIGLGGDHELGSDGAGDHFGGEHGGLEGHAAAGDGHHDGAAGHHESATLRFLGVLSLRTIVAALTFFGLSGLAAGASGVSPLGTFAIASAAGVSALYLVAWIMRSLMRLRSDGTVRIHNAVGELATVYLTIPGRHSGKGKVTVTVQQRTMEYEAETDHEALTTGTPVQVVGVLGPDIVDVVPAPEPARSSHA